MLGTHPLLFIIVGHECFVICLLLFLKNLVYAECGKFPIELMMDLFIIVSSEAFLLLGSVTSYVS